MDWWWVAAWAGVFAIGLLIGRLSKYDPLDSLPPLPPEWEPDPESIWRPDA